MASTEDSDRPELWWGLLKGYTYSAVHCAFGQSLPGMLVSRPDVVERVVSALESGLVAVVREGRVKGWSDGGGATATRVAAVRTPALVAELRAAVAAERDMRSALKRVR